MGESRERERERALSKRTHSTHTARIRSKQLSQRTQHTWPQNGQVIVSGAFAMSARSCFRSFVCLCCGVCVCPSVFFFCVCSCLAASCCRWPWCALRVAESVDCCERVVAFCLAVSVCVPGQQCTRTHSASDSPCVLWGVEAIDRSSSSSSSNNSLGVFTILARFYSVKPRARHDTSQHWCFTQFSTT